MRYAWIETHRDCDPLGLLRRVLQVSRVMGELGLAGRHKRHFVKTIDSNHDEPIAANRLGRDFTIFTAITHQTVEPKSLLSVGYALVG